MPPESLSALYCCVDTSRENMADHGCNIRGAAVLYVAACTTSTAASRITPTLQGSYDDVTTRSPIILSQLIRIRTCQLIMDFLCLSALSDTDSLAGFRSESRSVPDEI